MPPAQKKQAVVIIYDLKCKDQDLAKKTLHEILTVAKFKGLKDIFKIVLMNTTNSYGLSYNNMDVAWKINCPSMPELVDEYLSEAEVCGETETANWLQAVELACKLHQEIADSTVNNVVRKHIILITDFSSPLQENFDEFKWIQTVSSQLHLIGAFLYIAGPNVEIKETITYPNNDINLMKHINFGENLDENAVKNLELAKKLFESTPGLIINFKLAIDLYFFSQCFYPRQIQNDKLKLGDAFIPCMIFSQFIKKGESVKFKGARSSAPLEFVYKHDIQKTVPFDNVTSGIMLHGIFIQINEEVKNIFKTKPAKTFNILGFVNRTEIDEHLLGGESTRIVSSSSAIDNSDIFSSLVQTMLKEDKVAIAEWNYRKDLELKFFALIPQDNNMLIMANLPMFEDIKKQVVEGKVLPSFIEEENVQNSKLEKGDVNKIYDFLEKHDVVEQNNAFCSLKMDVNLCLKPSNRIIYQRLRNKFLNKPLDEDVGSFNDFINFVEINNEEGDEENEVLIPPVDV